MGKTIAPAVLALSFVGFYNAQAAEYQWKIGDAVFCVGPLGSMDEVAVKDPSIVFFEGKWHLFYTASSEEEYTTGYASAEELTGLQAAKRHSLDMIRGESSRYGCAPQVFYFSPQRKWYLVFQNRDANYQPAFATTETIARPETWSDPKPLIRKDSRAKWIDFWLICDQRRAYLFYTQAHSAVIVRSTSLGNFPAGWGEAVEVLRDVHEAVHIYAVKDRNEYHMIYERNSGGIRSFGLATSVNLEGPWKKVTDEYATGNQLKFTGKLSQWTDMVSHGEVIRLGHNERMQYDPEDCRWLIQGVLKRDYESVPYPKIPWKLGLMTKSKPISRTKPEGFQGYLQPDSSRREAVSSTRTVK